MIEAIGDFLAGIAVYLTAVFGLVALYFLWVAFREWRTSNRAVFGVERDIAVSEMLGAISRAGIFVVIGLLIFALGWAGQQSEADVDNQIQPTTSGPPTATFPILATETIAASDVAATVPVETDQTPEPDETELAPPVLESPTPPTAVEPTPQTAVVTAFGGVWLRDAPNGGTIVVVPQDAVVQLLEGRETAGTLEWQRVRILEVPASPGVEAEPGQEGWVAFQFLQATP